MAITTTNEIAAPVNVILQTNLLKRAQAVCPYFVGSTPAEIREHSGSFTAKWRRYEHLTPTTTPLTELTGSVAFPTRSAVQPSVTDITATVQKFGNFVFLTEEVDLVNVNRPAAELSGVLGENAGRSLNRLQRNELEDNSTSIPVGATTATNVGGASGTGVITRGSISAAVNALSRQDARKFLPQTLGSQNVGSAPVRESYWGINHPDVTEDMRELTGFNSVEVYAGQTETAVGEYGHVGGVRFIESTESTIDAGLGAAATASATTDVRSTSGARTDRYNTVIFGKDFHGSLGLGNQHVQRVYRPEDRLPAVMMISHAKGSAGSADPLNEVASVGWKSWHAAKILNGNWGRVIVHSSSRLESAE
jgi:N4-gp56 family major capsid protein